MLKSFGKGMFGCFGVFIGFIILCIIGFAFLGNSSDSNTSKSAGETNTNNSSDNTLSKE